MCGVALGRHLNKMRKLDKLPQKLEEITKLISYTLHPDCIGC